MEQLYPQLIASLLVVGFPLAMLAQATVTALRELEMDREVSVMEMAVLALLAIIYSAFPLSLFLAAVTILE